MSAAKLSARAVSATKWRAANPNYQAEWRAKNPEKVKASKAKYRAKPETKAVEAAHWETYKATNAAAIAEQQAKYRDANRDRVNESQRQSRLNNLDRVRERGRRDYALNREARVAKSAAWNRENSHIRNARESERRATQLQAVPAWANHDLIADIYTLAKIYAEFLGEGIHVDHIVPLRSDIVGGLHVADNLQILPAFDNVSKGNRWWPDMPGEAA